MNNRSSGEQIDRAWQQAIAEYERRFGPAIRIPIIFARGRFLEACIGKVGNYDFAEQAPGYGVFCLRRAHRTYYRGRTRAGHYRPDQSAPTTAPEPVNHPAASGTTRKEVILTR